MSFVTKIYRDLNGDRQVIADGGVQKVESGGSVVIESGATFTSAVETVISAGVGAASTGVVAVETGNGAMHKTVLTVAAFTQAITGADLGFGKSIYTFPAGVIKADYATVDLTISGATETGTPDVGVGSVVASGSVTALNGTATFEDVMDGFTGTAITSTGSVSNNYVEAEAGLIDGHTTEVEAFLNLALGWTATESLTISGTITIFWTNLGDY